MNLKVDFAAGGIVLIDEKVLIVKNKKGDSSSDQKSWWGYPKGHLEEGESPSEAALREVYEETGFVVELKKEKPIAESRYEINLRGESVNKTVWFYEMSVVKPFDSEPDDEILEIAVVNYEDALGLLAHEEDKKILRYVFNK
jgi:8-oxo-dGTP pyrophosphatase MutT (NUDIX family)